MLELTHEFHRKAALEHACLAENANNKRFRAFAPSRLIHFLHHLARLHPSYQIISQGESHVWLYH
jgi:hypothetical protein